MSATQECTRCGHGLAHFLFQDAELAKEFPDGVCFNCVKEMTENQVPSTTKSADKK